jgi:hypothetical protein
MLPDFSGLEYRSTNEQMEGISIIFMSQILITSEIETLDHIKMS